MKVMFGGLEPDDRAPRTPPLADINMTPLIDVMLVLLVIFIITAPLFSHSIGVELPAVSGGRQSAVTGAQVAVSIDREGQFFWRGERVAFSVLESRMKGIGGEKPQPSVALSADQNTPYRDVARVIAAAQEAGVERFGFVVGVGK
jgi:biopolymer transport protein ExbD